MAGKQQDVGDFRADLARHAKGPRYETFFANAFSFRLGDNDCILRFMISEGAEDVDTAELQVAVAMTPKSVKVLAGILLDSMLELEHATGEVLPTKTERTQKLFEAAKAGWTPELNLER